MYRTQFKKVLFHPHQFYWNGTASTTRMTFQLLPPIYITLNLTMQPLVPVLRQLVLSTTTTTTISQKPSSLALQIQLSLFNVYKYPLLLLPLHWECHRSDPERFCPDLLSFTMIFTIWIKRSRVMCNHFRSLVAGSIFW